MKRFSVEDLWKIKRPSGISLAPDGARAVVSLSAYSMKDNRASASLWLLARRALRRLDGSPRWATIVAAHAHEEIG